MRIGMLFVIALLFSVISSSVADFPTCNKISCAKPGESCVKANTTCAWGSSCINGQCVAATAGSKCTSDEDCGGISLQCDITTNTCIVTAFAGPGEDCDSDDDCLFSNTCVDGACLSRGEGDPCSRDKGQCGYGFWCNNTCTPYIQEGGMCRASPTLFGNENQCGLLFDCIPHGQSSAFEGTCSKLYSQKDGAPCSKHSHCKSTMCNGTVCVPFFPSSFIKCTSDSQCYDSETCTCDHRTGQGTCLEKTVPQRDGCQDYYKDLLGCLNENNCAYLSFGANSCANQKCSGHYGCYINKCHNPKFQDRFSDTLPESCLPTLLEGNCPYVGRTGLTTTQIVLIALGSFILVLFLVGLVYFLAKRRHHDYELVR